MTRVAIDRPAPRAAAAPWTLTASDGSGLQLTRVDAHAVVEGPLAFTELHLYFHNPEDRVREGTFAITLPPRAAVSRFAMERDDGWQEAEVVEKALARRAYDDFLHRRQDPALLEKAAGNQFTARVFPIPAGGDKHLVLSFSQELAGRAYVLPLLGLPTVGRIDVQLDAIQLDGSHGPQTLSEHDWQPDHDFVATAAPAAAAVTAGDLVVAVVPFDGAGATAAAEAPRQLTVLVDTSASRALGFAGYVASIRALIGELHARYGDPLDLEVVAFDQDTQPIYRGDAAGYGDAADRALVARGAAGASDLGQALAALTADGAAPHRRVVVVSDGVVTAGADTAALVTAAAALPVDRVDVVLVGGLRDERLGAALVRARSRAGDVLDLDDGVAAVAAALGEPVIVDAPVEVAGASWVYPRRIPAVRPGTPVVVYARVPGAPQTLDVTIGGARQRLGLGEATPALIERAVAGAELEELEARLDAAASGDDVAALRAEIARRSTAARVLSSQTSMLVLESEADYDRYHIARTALADILVIGTDGVEVTRRAALQIAAAGPGDEPPPPPDDDAADREVGSATDVASQFDSASTTGGAGDGAGDGDDGIAGGLLGDAPADAADGFGFGRSGFGPGGGGSGWGTIGTGRYGTIGHGSGTGSGYGVGGGRGGMRGRTASVPSVRIGAATVEGGLDRAIIRRYVRRNLPKITYCYEKQLLSDPGLAGQVATTFTITPDGTVTGATATGVHAEVARCIAAVLATVQYPRPTGGAVRVAYPFVFSPTGGSDGGDGGSVATGAAADDEDAKGEPPLTGKLADIMDALRRRKLDVALTRARAWHAEAPGDVLALIGLGEALEARKDVAAAARVYGSIIDLFPGRADLRRFAGERLERLGDAARALAIDTYRRAVADRPDHVTGHRLLAYALERAGDHAGAFAAILAGIDQPYPEDRFPGADRVLAEDAGMLAAVYLAADGPRADVERELTARHLEVADQPSTRFIMYWETDANDVDFHIRDARGGHAWYSSMELPSGGELYADNTTGYGPECFAIPGTPKAGPYRLSINYYSQGPMGYGMGLLQIQRFDGKHLRFEDRPYVIMVDHAFVDLGTYR
ncbi:MAG: AgmX/PglI C-terminal domain-containing protein [Kofleriaceae bacterium]|nr:AgmX/PglI C-terminal domain-containing protein [Kofleriaceae bacterium]